MAAPLAIPVSPAPSSKRSRSRDSTRSSTANSVNGGSDAQSEQSQALSQSPPDIAPLPAFLRQSRTEINRKFVDLEWEQRNRMAQGSAPSDPPSQWARLNSEEVFKRNRYLNVDPWLNNRVRLKVPEGHSDYINASPIVVKATKSGVVKNFIATQGPKEGIYAHIWRMLWHETADPAVVVMLTQTHESGREKCFQYFPASLKAPTLEINEEDEFEDGFKCTVTLVSVQEDEETQTTIREMEVKTADGDVKKVWHLLFSGWPDFLVPEGDDKAALLKLLELSQEKNAPGDSPRIVHCSAGVGRSGTFIALDWLIQELEEGSLDEVDDSSDPVFEIVDKLRMQRMMMVQSETQFAYLYEVVKDLWVERWRKRNGFGPSTAASECGNGENERQRKLARLEADLEVEMRENVERS